MAKYILSFIKYYPFYIGMISILSIIVGLHSFINAYLIKKLLELIANHENISLRSAILPVLVAALNYEIFNLCWRAMNYIHLKNMPSIRNYFFLNGFKSSYESLHNDSNISLKGHTLQPALIHTEAILTSIFTKILYRGTQIIAAIIGMYLVHIYFALFFTGWAILFILLSCKYSHQLKALSELTAQKTTDLMSFLSENIKNMINVIRFNTKSYEIKTMKNYIYHWKTSYYNKYNFQDKYKLIQGTSVTLISISMLILLFFMRSTDSVTVAEFAFILSICLYISESVRSFSEQIDLLNTSMGVIDNSVKMLNQTSNIVLKTREKIGIFEKLELRDVSFHYPGQGTLLDGVNLTINVGDKVAIIGPTGIGKSTILSLMLGWKKAYAGKILLNQMPIENYQPKSISNIINIAMQEPMLYNRSIKENIAYGKIEVAMEDIARASQSACIHDNIIKLQDQYETLVGESGSALSGGQRKLIEIARLIIYNAPVWLLDEVTSNLDDYTRVKLMCNLSTLFKDKTVVMVTHQKDNLKYFDRIIKISEGKLVETQRFLQEAYVH